MAISFTSVKCPECGASFEIEKNRNIAYCSYCGTKIILSNENEYIFRTVDEAEIIKAETQRRTTEAEFVLRKKEMERMDDKEKQTKPFIIVLFVLGIVFLAVGAILLITNKEDIAERGMVGMMILLLGMGFLIFPIVLVSDQTESRKRAANLSAGLLQFPVDPQKTNQMDVNALASFLSSAGFSNIQIINLHDIRLKGSRKRGRIESITINGDLPQRGTWYNKTDLIVISYHGMSTDPY